MAVQSKQFMDFGKGQDTFTRDTMIKDEETPFVENVWSVGKNSVAKRNGTVKFMEISGASKVQGLGTFYTSSVRELLAMGGGKLYKELSGSASQIGSTTWDTSARVDFCQAAGKDFISNGVNNLRQYDGSTIADTTNGVIGKFSIFYKGCLWIAGNPTYPTRLYRSGTDTKIGDFTYDASTNPLATSVYIGKDDGQNITGLFKHQDYLYITKENSIWSVNQGTDEYGTITIKLIDASRGCVHHSTIDSVENDIFFFNDIGTYAFGYEPNIQTQIRTNIVSLRIDPDIKTIQKNRLPNVAGMYFDNHYYLSYTLGGDIKNNVIHVYDRQRLGWWKFTNISASCFTEYKDSDGYSRLYYGSDEDGSIYYFSDTAKNDNGTVIASTWKSAKYGFKNDFQEKFYLFAMLYFGRTPGKMSIQVYVDGILASTTPVVIGNDVFVGIGTASIGTYSIGMDGGSVSGEDTGGGDFYKIPINKIGRNVQFVITDSELAKGWELNGIQISFSPLSIMYQPLK